MDRTVIVWNDFKKAIQVEGHKQAVWAVKFVGEDRLLTGKPYHAGLRSREPGQKLIKGSFRRQDHHTTSDRRRQGQINPTADVYGSHGTGQRVELDS